VTYRESHDCNRVRIASSYQRSHISPHPVAMVRHIEPGRVSRYCGRAAPRASSCSGRAAYGSLAAMTVLSAIEFLAAFLGAWGWWTDGHPVYLIAAVFFDVRFAIDVWRLE